MTVVTISREIGSLGTEIARETAAQLGCHFADKDCIAQMLSQYGLVKFGQEYESLPGFLGRYDSRRAKMVDMLNRVIRALAAHGNMVILGRGSFALLTGYSNVLNVRTQAPQTTRVKRIMEQQKLSSSAAETIVNENDLVRANFIESSYDVRWYDATLFDLVVDTSKVPPTSVTKWLIEAAANLPVGLGATKPSTAEIEVDPVLANVVCQTFECHTSHNQLIDQLGIG